MQIYPAIDLFEGKVVRLLRGDYKQLTVYSEDPAQTARQWAGEGAKWLHVVDLEGAKAGNLTNLDSLRKIRSAVDCKIQVGGGIRSLSDIDTLVQNKIDRIILGTRALDKNFLTEALRKHSDKIAVGLDVRDGCVQTQGWLNSSDQTLAAALRVLKDFPIGTLIYTDIHRDGTLEGPNAETFVQILNTVPFKVILSGGVGTLSDLQKVTAIKNSNFEGVIVGKALYEKKFTLRDAVQLFRNPVKS